MYSSKETVYIKHAICFLVLTGMVLLKSSICWAETTQAVLSKYKDDIEKTVSENSKPADQKIRDQLLQQLKGKFAKDIQTAAIPGKTISQHFDTLLDNIAAANSGFRFKDGDGYKDQFIKDAATTFVREAKSASDIKGTRTPSGWFETFTGMLQQLRDKLASHKGLGSQVASMIAPVFMDVYKASDMNNQGDAKDDYKAQLALVKRLFPITKPELAEKNQSIAQMLEGFATTIFKERTQ